MGVEKGARGTGGQGGISYLYPAGQGGDPRVMVDMRFRGIADSPRAEGWDLAGIPRHAAHLRRECVPRPWGSQAMPSEPCNCLVWWLCWAVKEADVLLGEFPS